VLLLTLSSASYEWRFVPENTGGFTDQGTTQCHRTGQQPSPSTVPRPDPFLSRLSMTHRRFRVGRGTTPLSARRKPPRGSAFRYRLSEPATVTIQIYKVLPGRKVGHRCSPYRRRFKHRRRCTRLVRTGTLIRRARSGPNRTAFQGRIRRRALKPGRYKAKLTALAPGALHRSPPRAITFTVLAR
jgi:hypothetical protein